MISLALPPALVSLHYIFIAEECSNLLCLLHSLPLSLILFLSIYLILQGTVIVGNEIHGLKVKHLHVGGVLGSGEVQSGIRGCIQVRPCHHGNSNCLLLCLLLWVFRVNNITEYH